MQNIHFAAPWNLPSGAAAPSPSPPFLFPTHTSIRLSSLFVNCLSRTHDPRRKLRMSNGSDANYVLCNAYFCLLVSLAARITAVCHDERRDSPILPPERSCALRKREMYYSRLVSVSRLGFSWRHDFEPTCPFSTNDYSPLLFQQRRYDSSR
jgi:hypothetical protein